MVIIYIHTLYMYRLNLHKHVNNDMNIEYVPVVPPPMCSWYCQLYSSHTSMVCSLPCTCRELLVHWCWSHCQDLINKILHYISKNIIYCEICQWWQISGFQGSVHEYPSLTLRRGVKILMIKYYQLNKIYLV